MHRAGRVKQRALGRSTRRGFVAMADLYLKAFRHWFDSNEAFLAQNGVRVSLLRECKDQTNSIAHAEVETEHSLGDVSLWEYEEGYALTDTDFVEIATEEFHPEHHELHSPQELSLLLSKFVLQMVEATRPLSP